MLQFCTRSGSPPEINRRVSHPGSRCPSGARTDVAEGCLRTLGSLRWPCFSKGRSKCCASRLRIGASGDSRRLQPDLESRSPDPRARSRSRPGGSPSTSCGCSGVVERQSARFLDVFRRSNKFSEVQAVCVAQSQPARRSLSGRLRGADRAAAAERAGGRAIDRRIQSTSAPPRVQHSRA